MILSYNLKLKLLIINTNLEYLNFKKIISSLSILLKLYKHLLNKFKISNKKYKKIIYKLSKKYKILIKKLRIKYKFNF